VQLADFKSQEVIMAVTFINCFEFPAGREDEFFELFKRVNAYMRSKPGYLGHKMHRALTADASFRFINVVQWASAELCLAAHDEGFRNMVSEPAKVFQFRPGLYEVVHEREADGNAAGAASERFSA
jgi:heme-degrading monooxygenase HmoA